MSTEAEVQAAISNIMKIDDHVSHTSTESTETTDQEESADGETLNPHSFCIEECKYENKKQSKSMERCCMCMRWFHQTCVGIKKDDPPGVWNCESCRNIHSDVLYLKTSMKKLMATVSTMAKTMNSLNSTLIEKTTAGAKLETENQALREQVNSLTQKLQKKTWENFSSKPALVLGDSIVRDIDDTKLINTSVRSLSRANVTDVRKTLEAAPESYQSITLVIGANDCSNEDVDVMKLTKDYQELVDLAKTHVPSPDKITISSITPRTDAAGKQEKVEATNAALCNLAETNGVLFVNNDATFKLGDNTINDGYLLGDGMHLNHRGTTRLVNNLKLRAKKDGDIIKTRKRTSDRPQHNPNARSSSAHQDLSNNDGTVSFNPYGCVYCNEGGHRSSQCRHKGPVTCNKCKKQGHKAKHHIFSPR